MLVLINLQISIIDLLIPLYGMHWQMIAIGLFLCFFRCQEIFWPENGKSFPSV
jgi:hypothetical protein